MNNKVRIATALVGKTLLNNYTDSDSSEDELLIEIQRKKHKIDDYVNNTVLNYCPSDFNCHFRMTKSAIEDLCSELPFKSHVRPGRHPIRPTHAILLLLWTLASQESFREIAERFGLQKGNAQTIFLNTCKLICGIKNRYIIWPDGDNFRKTVNAFNNLRGNNSFPNVVGCVDGTHIAIKGPTKDKSFYNRKGYHSAILQVICNSNLEFIDVFFGWPGSTHYARVWQNSPIYKRLSQDHLIPDEYHILGDTAYPVDSFIITPYKDNGHLTPQKKIFNQKLSSSRVVVEQAIGRLKQAFRRLKFLNAKLENCKFYVMTACILHNYCIKKNIDLPEGVENRDTLDDVNINLYENEEIRGQLKRDRLLAMLQ